MANSSNQLSHPLRSEPTSKPAGLHLNNWLRLSHDRGPPNTVELTRFNNFAPILQAITAGSLVVGEIGVAPSIIGLTRGIPLIAPFLSAFSTPSHPVERIMVMQDSPIKTLDDL